MTKFTEDFRKRLQARKTGYPVHLHFNPKTDSDNVACPWPCPKARWHKNWPAGKVDTSLKYKNRETHPAAFNFWIRSVGPITGQKTEDFSNTKLLLQTNCKPGFFAYKSKLALNAYCLRCPYGYTSPAASTKCFKKPVTASLFGAATKQKAEAEAKKQKAEAEAKAKAKQNAEAKRRSKRP